MFFTISLYVALAIFGLGLIYRCYTWLTYKIGKSARDIPFQERLVASAKGIVLAIFSPKLFALVKALVLDVVLQQRILKEDFLRWLMHMCIFAGFMGLLLMHALDEHVMAPFLAGYAPTMNPFLLLRDLFGGLVLLGLVIALYRRFVLKAPRLKTSGMDHYAIAILAVIMVSGVLLEGTKIVSYSAFQDMVDEYGDEDAAASLEALWVAEFGLVTPNVQGPVEPEALEEGRLEHETSCVSCHSSPQSAFLGYAVSRAIKPMALSLDQANARQALWYVHFLACFLGLAYLPFSKFLHVVVSPLSLLVDSVIDPERSDRANIATKKALELDACTRCSTCSLWCSVAASLQSIDFPDVLPSERIKTLKTMAASKDLTDEQFKQIWEGTFRCTLCGRCREVCPVGIGLKDLWKGMREDLIFKGHYPPNVNILKGAIAGQHNAVDYPNDERAMWVDFLDEPPDDLFQRQKAEVVYFIGCIASFSPAVQNIPETFCNILTKANVDFTIMGEKEWCCGFPLLVGGVHEGVEELKQHNIKAVREIGAKTMVFSCPSCFHTWSHEYHGIDDIRLMHSTQFLEELIHTGKIKLEKEVTQTVTYHDPCDLGRASGVYSAPRRVIRSVPGVKFVELAENSRKSLCCGGGGDMEMADPNATAAVSKNRAAQIREIGAKICATGCQQCVRSLTNGTKAIEADIEILDVIQLVWRSMA